MGLTVAALTFAVTWSSHARATYSIVAMDRDAGRYGVATASCVELSVLRRVYASAAEKGAVLTQSYLVAGDASQALGLETLDAGGSAAQAITAMTAASFDPDFERRQYVVLDALGDLAAFSGDETLPYADARDASFDGFGLGVAGNVLTGGDVLEQAVVGFAGDGLCDLEARLMNALVVASRDGRGDDRCVVDGRPARAAWLHVDAASGGGEALDLSVDSAVDAALDPVQELAAQFEVWRQTQACPAEPAPVAPSEQVSSTTGPASTGCQAAGGQSSTAWPWMLGAIVARCRRRRSPARRSTPEPSAE
jgi:uncharacterized Ntn-hydrolase superfamily protein